MNRLSANNVSFAYEDMTVLQDVSIQITPGQATALLGPSGSGKSTLLWLLAGLIEPSAGTAGIEVDGQGIISTSKCNDRIGMVFQQPILWEHLTVEKHLDLVLTGRKLRRKERYTQIARTLGQVHLESLCRRHPWQLSGGERQRLAIARALVIQPDWLILDEPLAHLDGQARSELFEILQQILSVSKSGIIMATHNADEAMRLAQTVAILLDQRIAQVGPPEQVYLFPTDIRTARALGPAFVLAGEANNGVLSVNGTKILEGLPTFWSGRKELILRPTDVSFEPEASGAAKVNRAEFSRGSFALSVEIGEMKAKVQHPSFVRPETAGNLKLIRYAH